MDRDFSNEKSIYTLTEFKDENNKISLKFSKYKILSLSKTRDDSGSSRKNWTLYWEKEEIFPELTEGQTNERSYYHQILLDELLRVSELNLSKIRYDIYEKKKPKK